MTAHDPSGWSGQIPWGILPVLVIVPLSWLWLFWKRLVGRRKSRKAGNWPTVEGCALYAHVTDGLLENSPEKYVASFSYYFSLNRNGETDYFSGEFSRLFPEEDPAQKWLNSLKDKKIPVRVHPGNPNLSAVLFEDLVARFPLPLRAMLDSGLKAAGVPSKLPYVLRWPTEMVASLVALGFCLSLADHLSRVLADKPLYPNLATALWVELAVVVLPFETWFRRKSSGSSVNLGKAWTKSPAYLRFSTYALNLYLGSYWLTGGTHFAEYFHLHWNHNRLDPMANGAFLALLLGSSAASLYGRLESIEESPDFSAVKLHPE